MEKERKSKKKKKLRRESSQRGYTVVFQKQNKIPSLQFCWSQRLANASLDRLN